VAYGNDREAGAVTFAEAGPNLQSFPHIPFPHIVRRSMIRSHDEFMRSCVCESVDVRFYCFHATASAEMLEM
jgi:hypothetical protein